MQPRAAPPAATPVPEAEPEPEPEPVAAVEVSRRNEQPEEQQPEAASDADVAPVDLTGVTLTNGSGQGWATAVGNGASMRGALRQRRHPVSTPMKPAAGSTPVSAKARRARPASREDIVPLSDLSRKPSPPALEGLLRSHYPAEARRAGLAGDATVVARIDPDGLVREVRLGSETSSGFGSACKSAVLGSRWSPPLGSNGRAVATRVYYTCRFRVER